MLVNKAIQFVQLHAAVHFGSEGFRQKARGSSVLILSTTETFKVSYYTCGLWFSSILPLII